MGFTDQFVVDWFISDDALPSDAAAIGLQGARRLGLYQVKKITQGAMISSQGDAPVPVGAQLDINDFQKVIPGALCSLVTTVTQSDQEGIHLA